MENTKEEQAVMSYEGAYSHLITIKSTILEKARKNMESPLRLSYEGVSVLGKTLEGVLKFTVDFSTNKTTITFLRDFSDKKFIEFIGLSSSDYDKLFLVIRKENLQQEFNIWFKSVLALNKHKLLL